ncbi:MAG: HAD-IA family hydrolase, partial [Candidatus Eremiobacterota bacterium]
MNKKLITLINKAKYISFDIFDTAILRRILYPEDLFDLISFKIPEFKDFDFKDMRIKSECIARKNISELNKNSDITLYDIYKNIQVITDSDDIIIEKIKTLEIETELDVCRQNEYIHNIYTYCLEKKKKIIFASDMYLPYNTIEKILVDNGYKEFHRLFLSSHHNLTKTSGELFNLIIKELACKPEEILHIGDNYRSDVINSWKKGLMSYYYEKPLGRALRDKEFKRLFNMFPEQDISISIYLASIVNKYYSERNNPPDKDAFWYDLGYKTSGILYLGLTLWLIERTEKNKGEKLYLLSRDGYIIKKIYDLIRDNNKELPDAEYLYSSRRAFYIPSITELNDETLKFLMNPLCNDLSVAQYLERINLNPDLYKDKIDMAGFSSKESRVKTEGDYKKLKQLFIMLEEDILKQAGKERDILVKYLLQCDLLNNKVINIFDLGWYGSIQRGLKKLINLINDKNITVKGYYLGTHPISSDLNTESYIINCGYPEEQFRILHSNTKV